MSANLFEDSTSSSSSDGEDASDIRINQEFARRFEHNKRREDLQRFEELKKRGLVDGAAAASSASSDAADDSDADDDLQFYSALVKVKNQDPTLQHEDTILFDSDSGSGSDADDDGEKESKKKKKKKKNPLYLKDVVAKQLIEEGPDLGENEMGPRVKTYGDEQEEIRQAFLKAANDAFDGDGDGVGDLLVEKKRDGEDAEGRGGEGAEVQRQLDEYFGEDGGLNENEMFLKNFFRNKLWVDRERGRRGLDDEEGGIDYSEDEEELEKQDKYESEYNFRYEEGAGDRILGHSRIVEGSIRKTSNPRKEQRKNKAERMKRAERERQEELKHLKNVKWREINEKLEKIRSVAGIVDGGACAFGGDDLEEEFDPEDYDRVMTAAFDEDYYAAEDADPGFGSGDEYRDDLEKPDFDKEDEMLGLPKDWDVLNSGSGFEEARRKMLKHKGDVGDAEEYFDSADKEEGGKRKRKRKISLKEKVALEKDLDEYFKLDYEDTIGDLRTRFKYTTVQPNRFGLTSEEVLMMDDKDLNQYVSLKKLAPFREDEWKVSKQKRYQQKMKKKLLLEGAMTNDAKNGKKHKSKEKSHAGSFVSDSKVSGRAQFDESNVAEGSASKKSRRKRRLAELKLSKSRRMAYGEIPSKPKKQKNN